MNQRRQGHGDSATQIRVRVSRQVTRGLDEVDIVLTMCLRLGSISKYAKHDRV